MTLTVAQVAAHVQAPAGDPFPGECLARATPMVARLIGTVTVPDEIRDLAILEVATDLYQRKQSRNGVATFDTPELQPFRITRDPISACLDILAPFLGPGIA